MYPTQEPFHTGMLRVSDIHQLYYEVSGKENGTPVVFLHGGPGGGTTPGDRAFFNPEKYKIILFDQRGAGKSTPHASIEDNTTWDLVEDIETLRKKFNVDKWHVFGGSWGSTLGLLYAQTHPERVKSLVLRGITTLRKSELAWFFQNGTSHLFPEYWEEFVNLVPENERHDVLRAYHTQLNSPDQHVRVRAARAWTKYGMATCKLHVDPAAIAFSENDHFAMALARIENNYFVNDSFIREGQILEQEAINKIRHIPTIVVQGRYDLACPATTAWQLKKAFPELTLHIVPDAGHSAREESITRLLVEATDHFSNL